MRTSTLALIVATALAATTTQAKNEKWVGTWATAPEGAGFLAPLPDAESLLGRTLRQVVNLSVGGERVRVRLSNVDGSAPLSVASAHIALQDIDASIVPETDRPLTFGGQASVTIAAGADVWSDPVQLSVPAHARAAVSLYLAPDATDPISPVSFNQFGLQTTYTGAGDQTAAADLVQDDAPMEAVYWVTGVDVVAKKGTNVIAFLGDSLTDGFDAARLGPKNPFPSVLAERLASRPGANPNANQQWGLLNVGISGNQVTASTLNRGAQVRFDRDVLGQSGVTHVFIFEGINDIGVPPLFGLPDIPAKDIIDGLSSLADRARAAGLKTIGATLTPFQGFPLVIVGPYFTAEGEAKRQEINEWIRTSDAFDAVVDFDAAVQDPHAPTFIRAEFDSDGLHLNEPGYNAVGGAIPLKLLTTNRVLKNP